LGELKNGEPTLRRGTVRILEAGQGRLAYVRQTEEASAFVYVNRTGEEWSLPHGGELLFGRGLQCLGDKITLLPYGFCVIILFLDKMVDPFY